jgi:integrase
LHTQEELLTVQEFADLRAAVGSTPRVPVTSQAVNANVPAATPLKRRRGKCMSRRSGQIGHEEKSGKWYVVRFWMDVPGQEDRKLVRARICPISGPGTLSATERFRRRKEIIATSGADSEEHFNRVVEQQKLGVTFREQAAWWLNQMRNRKRSPVAPSTIEWWESCLDNWLNPNVGDVPLAAVNNTCLKGLVAQMVASDLSPKTIKSYAQVVKQVVASAVVEEGGEVRELYPRKWDHDFIDLPVVKRKQQNTPSFTREIVAGLTRWPKERERVLFILCAATGLRIGEALGVEIKHISQDFLTISIVQKVRSGRVEQRLKSEDSFREVDLHSSVAALLKEYVGDRKSGFLFCTRNGKPLWPTNIVRRHLHQALKELGYVNPIRGNHKAGNHAFRRFRLTYLRNYTNCPQGLIDFWMGHAADDMSDLYDKIKDDLAFRRAKAEEVGIGFEIGPIVPNVPNVPKSASKEATRIAA